MQKLRILRLGVLMVTASCTDDGRVVGDALNSTATAPATAGGQPGADQGSGGSSIATGSGVGGGQSTGGTVATSLTASGGTAPLASSGLGGAQPTGGAMATSLTAAGGTTLFSSSGIGGVSSTGGTSSVAVTTPDEICSASPVQLLLTTSTPAAYCLEGCSGFVSILTADGQPFTSLSTDPCTFQPLCSTCSAPTCTDLYCGPMQWTNGSAGMSWQGAYDEAGTCGQNVACSHGRCVTSGHFIARFCATTASSSGSCNASSARTCVDVPFDFPTTTTVQAVLPAINGTGGSTSTGGSSSTGVTGTGGNGGSVGSGGTAAAGGTHASGGTVSTGTAAGGVCNSGCVTDGTSTTSPYCDQPNVTLVCWGPYSTDERAIMTANGCTDVPTGAVRYCCPAAILTQCQ